MAPLMQIIFDHLCEYSLVSYIDDLGRETLSERSDQLFKALSDVYLSAERPSK